MLDAVVIGGGPAGVAAALTLVDSGHTVVLVERLEFPRPHIGESLVPEAMRELQALGVYEALKKEGFTSKPGARFVHAEEGLDVYLGFAGQQDLPTPWQVERDRFDYLLLEQARLRGVQLKIPCSVRTTRLLDDRVEVNLESAGGVAETLTARYVIDTSGQRSMLASQLGLRRRVKGVSTHAYSSYLKDLERPHGGSIEIAFCEGGWLWNIPLRNGVNSVGVVVSDAAKPAGSPAEIFTQRSGPHFELQAEQVAQKLSDDVLVHSAINHCCLAYSQGRAVLAGDAAGFLDPVFSTGVYVALWSGRRAAAAVSQALSSGSSESAFEAYGRTFSRLHGVAYELIRMFYGGRFTRLLSTLGRRPEVEDEVVALLSGDFLSGHGAIGQALLRRAEQDRSIAED